MMLMRANIEKSTSEGIANDDEYESLEIFIGETLIMTMMRHITIMH